LRDRFGHEGAGGFGVFVGGGGFGEAAVQLKVMLSAGAHKTERLDMTTSAFQILIQQGFPANAILAGQFSFLLTRAYALLKFLRLLGR